VELDDKSMATEDDIFDFVAKHRGMRREKLNLSDRLGVDLGMDGDDAVEFFEEFEKKFKVNLDYLGEHWDEYFGPEGTTGSGPILFACIGMLPAIVLGILFHLPSWIVVIIGLATMIAAMYIIGTRNNRRECEHPTLRQISISNLIASVQQKSFAHD
jgi:acyl carrier protein